MALRQKQLVEYLALLLDNKGRPDSEPAHIAHQQPHPMLDLFAAQRQAAL
jgi:hypothetical protein